MKFGIVLVCVQVLTTLSKIMVDYMTIFCITFFDTAAAIPEGPIEIFTTSQESNLNIIICVNKTDITIDYH